MRFGDFGENLAAEFLRRKGYRILGRNVRVGRVGELDIIARQGATVVFVEVKARRSDRFGLPEEALTPAKRLHLRRAIAGWLAMRGLSEARFRTDVVAVDASIDPPVIRHHPSVEL